jgi:hypothetical protein
MDDSEIKPYYLIKPISEFGTCLLADIVLGI